MDRARVIFGNEISEKDYEKACKAAQKNRERFGDDFSASYHLRAEPAPVIGSRLGVRMLKLSDGDEPLDLAADAAASPVAIPTAKTVGGAGGRPVVIGNIRMGFGHYRIAMAFASAARAMGYTPYWFDLCAFEGSTCTKLVEHQNKLYSMGSRLSQRVSPFNSLYWEPLNSEGFRQLSYNAGDLKNAELMTPVYRDLPRDVPFIGTHAWPAQAAVAAHLTHVVDAIPDNWPMALHLAEGALHTVQTPGAEMGYRMLRGMAADAVLKPMPAGSIANVGHYIDHELAANVETDCDERMLRAEAGEPVRYLICVGGAGAQQGFIAQLVRHLMEYVERGEATLLINVGDHANVLKGLKRSVPALKKATEHEGFGEVEALCTSDEIGGVHLFYDPDIFGAVYSTNVLMRWADVLVTKPGELAFYPVPKMMIKRVGGHEAMNAIRAAELGDGTYELATADEACAFADLLQADRGILADMCKAIVRNKTAGIYDGAYEVVRLVTEMQD